MKAAFDRCMTWSVDHRAITFLAVMVISGLALIGHTRPHWVRQFFVAQQKAMKHPLVGGPLLSEDGQTQLLLVSFDLDF